MHTELFENVPEALLVVDDQGCIVRANRHSEELFGYASGSLLGKPVEILIPPSVRGRHYAHRAGYMIHPQVRPMGASDQALIGQRFDGRQFPVEIALSPVTIDGGQRGVLASIRDISESQRARQALVRAKYDAIVARFGQRALESVDSQSVIDSLPSLIADTLEIQAVAVVILGPDNSRVDVSAAVGLDAGQRATLVTTRAGEDPLTHVLLGGGTVVVDEASPHATSLRRLGDRFESMAVVPLLGHHLPMGALVALSGDPRTFAHDAMHFLQSVANMLAALAQRQRTEEILAHAQRLDAIGKLTGGVAHDFNNLLTIISGNLQLLEDCVQEPHKAGAMIGSALHAARRGAELTSKLLAFARRQRLQPQPVSPGRTLEEIGEMLRRTLDGNLQIVVHPCDDALPDASADPTQLDSALLNLALNARDALPEDGGTITLSASDMWASARNNPANLDPGHYVVFAIEDNGAGMAPATIARAVEPFFTTKDGGQGSGLGLSMVYGFARQSGGSLSIDSRLGRGTRIKLYLPVARQGAGVEPQPDSVIGGHGQAILVVEDDAGVRAIATAFLDSLGYRSYAAATAGEALRCLSEHADIALLFSDILLGEGMNGHGLAAAARNARPDIAVLLASGHDDITLSSQAAGQLPHTLLRKPYSREQLATAIRAALEPAA